EPGAVRPRLGLEKRPLTTLYLVRPTRHTAGGRRQSLREALRGLPEQPRRLRRQPGPAPPGLGGGHQALHTLAPVPAPNPGTDFVGTLLLTGGRRPFYGL